ncbi:MAG TPA: hypothetical protein VGE39_00480 [Prosthecobacter sp.]
MSRPTPVPFDPDQHGQVVAPKRPAQEAETTAPLLSEILAAMPTESAPAIHPDDLKGTAKPLDKQAKWRLSELAEATYQHLQNAGQIPAGETLESFRRRIAVEACGRRISHASHGDRKLIQAAFLKLKGQVHQAARAVAQAASTPLDIAKHKLWEKVHELDLTPAYAESICRRFFRCTVAELKTPRQVWSVFYTVQNNANAAAGKGSPNNRFKSLRAKRQAARKPHTSL